MSYKVNDKVFTAVIALPGHVRYEYFVKKVADREQVWSLWSDQGWALAGDAEGHELIPVWPYERFAAACATGHWAGDQPRTITLSDWTEKWIPGMEGDGTQVAVFPTPNDRGVVVSPERLKQDLEKEIALYE